MKLITLENLGNGFLIDTSNKKINVQSSSSTSNNDIDVDFKLHFTTSTTLKVDVTEENL